MHIKMSKRPSEAASDSTAWKVIGEKRWILLIGTDFSPLHFKHPIFGWHFIMPRKTVTIMNSSMLLRHMAQQVIDRAIYSVRCGKLSFVYIILLERGGSCLDTYTMQTYFSIKHVWNVTSDLISNVPKTYQS